MRNWHTSTFRASIVVFITVRCTLPMRNWHLKFPRNSCSIKIVVPCLWGIDTTCDHTIWLRYCNYTLYLAYEELTHYLPSPNRLRILISCVVPCLWGIDTRLTGLRYYMWILHSDSQLYLAYEELTPYSGTVLISSAWVMCCTLPMRNWHYILWRILDISPHL